MCTHGSRYMIGRRCPRYCADRSPARGADRPPHHHRRAARRRLAGGQAAAEGEQGLRPAGRPGGEHDAGRGGEFGPYGERKRFDFFVRQLLGVTPPSWNDAAPADRQPGSSELRTRSRLGHRARRAEPAQVGCGASKSLLNIRCSSIHRSLTCRRMKRNFPRSRRTSPPGGARLSR